MVGPAAMDLGKRSDGGAGGRTPLPVAVMDRSSSRSAAIAMGTSPLRVRRHTPTAKRDLLNTSAGIVCQVELLMDGRISI